MTAQLRHATISWRSLIRMQSPPGEEKEKKHKKERDQDSANFLNKVKRREESGTTDAPDFSKHVSCTVQLHEVVKYSYTKYVDSFSPIFLFSCFPFFLMSNQTNPNLLISKRDLSDMSNQEMRVHSHL